MFLFSYLYGYDVTIWHHASLRKNSRPSFRSPTLTSIFTAPCNLHFHFSSSFLGITSFLLSLTTFQLLLSLLFFYSLSWKPTFLLSVFPFFSLALHSILFLKLLVSFSSCSIVLFFILFLYLYSILPRFLLVFLRLYYLKKKQYLYCTYIHI